MGDLQYPLRTNYPCNANASAISWLPTTPCSILYGPITPATMDPQCAWCLQDALQYPLRTNYPCNRRPVWRAREPPQTCSILYGPITPATYKSGDVSVE